MARVFNRVTKMYCESVDTTQYTDEAWMIDPAGIDTLLATGIAPKFWKDGGANTVVEMTQAEKDTAYLTAVKTTRLLEMKGQINAYIGSKYDLGQQVTMLALWLEGQDNLWVNRKNNVRSVVEWLESVLNHYYAKYDAVVACTTIPDVEAIQLALAQFDATCPTLTVRAIKDTKS